MQPIFFDRWCVYVCGSRIAYDVYSVDNNGCFSFQFDLGVEDQIYSKSALQFGFYLFFYKKDSTFSDRAKLGLDLSNCHLSK